VQLPVETVTHYFDRDKVKQVLINVIQNAYKFTGPGNSITVSLKDTGTAAVIRVRDDGIGIPAADVERVFERFYRVDKARSRDFGGTGLGLPIAREIIDAHGGTISLTSEPEQGTEVCITLPYLVEKGDKDACESA
jgi:two-component system sensor histidine kinase VicK